MIFNNPTGPYKENIMKKLEQIINKWLDKNITDGRTMYTDTLVEDIEEYVIKAMIEEIELNMTCDSERLNKIRIAQLKEALQGDKE